MRVPTDAIIVMACLDMEIGDLTWEETQEVIHACQEQARGDVPQSWMEKAVRYELRAVLQRRLSDEQASRPKVGPVTQTSQKPLWRRLLRAVGG